MGGCQVQARALGGGLGTEMRALSQGLGTMIITNRLQGPSRLSPWNGQWSSPCPPPGFARSCPFLLPRLFPFGGS